MGRVQGPSAFGPTSLSCALSNSVSDCEKGRLAGQILIFIVITTPIAFFTVDKNRS